MWIKCNKPTLKVIVKNLDKFKTVFGADCFLEWYPEILTTGIEVALADFGLGENYYVVKNGSYVDATHCFYKSEFNRTLKVIYEQPSHLYEKWDSPESISEVFKMIKYKKMNESGFKNWVDQVKIEETRYLFPM